MSVTTRKVHIRPATSGDLKTMVTLLRELFQIETDFTFNENKQKAGLRRLLKDPEAVVLVAERDELVIGMCTVQVLISTAEGSRVGILEDMVVHDKFRGQGIGGELLFAAEEWARAHKLCRLSLLADRRNEAALGFYTSQGWQTTSMVCRRKNLPRLNRITAL